MSYVTRVTTDKTTSHANLRLFLFFFKSKVLLFIIIVPRNRSVLSELNLMCSLKNNVMEKCLNNNIRYTNPNFGTKLSQS